MVDEDGEVAEGEVVDGLPVVAEEDTELLEPRFVGALTVPTVQAAALAATGFVAGAATVAVVQRRRARVSGRKRRRKAPVLPEIVGSNSFLVDIHLLRRG